MLPNYQARSPFVLKHTTSIYVGTYVCHYFVLCPSRIFVLVQWSTLSQISLNRIIWFINYYLFVSRKQQYLLENSLSTRLTTNVSLV